MFRELRRSKQALAPEVMSQILQTAQTGFLAVLGDESYPYIVPLNFVCEENILYFHCASTGHKIDAIQAHSKVSFCVVGQDTVIPSKFTTAYQSVVVFGNAQIISDQEEKNHALRLLVKKYSPSYLEQGEQEILAYPNVCVVKIQIEHITGKMGSSLLP